MCPALRSVLLISMLGCVELISVTTPHKHVNVTKGAGALLQCVFQSTEQSTAALTVQWDFASTASMPQQVYYFQGGRDVVPEAYAGRLQPPSSPGTTKNASIWIRDMQPSDSGIYTCQVHNFPDVDGPSEANVIVNVLEKPSVPYCAVHGDVESGHRVTLTCHSEHGSPNPKYTWIRLDQTKTRRPVLGTATEKGTLEFGNISQFEFGEYQCTSTNAVGFSTCVIELSAEVSDGVVAGAVVGALLGCVLIALVVWFIAHVLKKHKYNRVKQTEANEMKRSTPQAQQASDQGTVATPASNLHVEEDEHQA
ncbi:V-set and immunoglobulin domain-containing protein 1-like [Clinocottus analis]|uniref:V-set and immunoglobulin domain-containing protein 1-like n=1 Tax=Clinocottus analis TaxID=304258 RepID=UPI0035C09CBA